MRFRGASSLITKLKCTPRSLFCVSSLPASEGASPVPQRRIRERERSFISHLIVRVVVVSSSSSTLLAHVLQTSVKLVKPSHTSCHTYQFHVILFWESDPSQRGRPTSTSPQSSSLEAIITRDTQVRAKMRGRRRTEEGRALTSDSVRWIREHRARKGGRAGRLTYLKGNL